MRPERERERESSTAATLDASRSRASCGCAPRRRERNTPWRACADRRARRAIYRSRSARRDELSVSRAVAYVRWISSTCHMIRLRRKSREIETTGPRIESYFSLLQLPPPPLIRHPSLSARAPHMHGLLVPPRHLPKCEVAPTIFRCLPISESEVATSRSDNGSNWRIFSSWSCSRRRRRRRAMWR